MMIQILGLAHKNIFKRYIRNIFKNIMENTNKMNKHVGNSRTTETIKNNQREIL